MLISIKAKLPLKTNSTPHFLERILENSARQLSVSTFGTIYLFLSALSLQKTFSIIIVSLYIPFLNIKLNYLDCSVTHT